ncbi:copper amine oxidase N-terminal domain-containing protein [Paenibacillus wynnii]|uniref:copper amine oxidase N-terminal domain-containing protein n=1 Tax=Paenibacillus wynnii TaxID=268407 RepID=UPI00068EC69A|nr:copper amine oxidase N-terminal domain-containing protein [Paenibacillus wynnii]
MKLIPSLLASLLLSSMIGLPAFAAEKPISVQLDQKKLNSSSAPVNDHGTILLPLRTIFENLGLKIEWDVKTGSITGTKEGLVVKLKVGSKQATVNGNVKLLTSAPKVINNVTYVPLRFVGEATGSSVKWDAKNSTVVIESKQPAGDPKEIAAFFEKYVDYYNKESLDELMSLIDPNSPMAQGGPVLKSQMELYDLAYSIDQLDIVDLKPNEAAIHTIESTHKISGPFSLDSKTDCVYTLTKQEGSKDWKISNLKVNDIQYIVPDEMLKATVTVPKAEEDAILAVLQTQIKSLNEENLNGMLSTLDSTSPLFEQTKKAFNNTFSTYDLLITMESSKIINYSENEAVVYTIQTAKKIKGPDFPDNRSVEVIILKKTKEGKWLVEADIVIKTDKL